MSFQIKNFIGLDGDKGNDNVVLTSSKGCMGVIEYVKDMSVTPGSAMAAYYSYRMNVRKRQLICDLSDCPVVIQAGAMQWMVGNVNMRSDVKGLGDMAGKLFKGAVTKEPAVKPRYEGTGFLVLEPTYKHLILLDASEWNGGIMLQDGIFLASEATLKHTLSTRSNLSSAVAGGEGLFNLCLEGSGVVCVESDVPKEELIEIELSNDVIKIDGNYAVAWSRSLAFSVERSGKSLVGSAVSGEGLANVYRGTGRLLMAPMVKMPNI